MGTPTPADESKLRRLNPLPAVDRDRLSTLPHELTPLIGREHDVARLTALLRGDAVRFLTLVGPGGVGKTRLALAVARALTGVFVDGVVFVPLAPVRDPRLVAVTVARARCARERRSAGDRSAARVPGRARIAARVGQLRACQRGSAARA